MYPRYGLTEVYIPIVGGRDLNKGWDWFVQGTSKVTEDDSELLTGRRAPSG
jgi:hypothetical protein